MGMINLSEDEKTLLDKEYNTSNHKVEIEKERLVKLELYYEFKEDFVVFINFDEIVVSDDLIDVGRFDLKTSIEDIIKEIYKNIKIVKNAEYFKKKYEGSLNSLKSKSDFFYEMILADFETSLKQGKRYTQTPIPNYISSEYILKRLKEDGFYFREENDFMGNSIIISLFEDEVS
jgi:hypothetical protein